MKNKSDQAKGFPSGSMMRIVIAALVVAGLVAVGLMSGPGQSAPTAAPAPAKKSINRTEDPVVVLAKAMAPMAGADLGKLALFAAVGGQVTPIPFQVDERAADGYFVYLLGPKADPSKGNKKLDGADELVFMVWDLGDQLAAGTALPCAPLRAAELAVKDPVGGGVGFVYLAECKTAPPRSPKDYVRQEADAQRDWVKTDRYHFAEQKGQSYFDRLALRGADGKVGVNLVDRIKGRGKLTAIGGVIKAEMSEASIQGNLQAYVDGPVRVIHLMVGYIKLSFIRLNIGGRAENLFYPNYFVTPIQVDNPIALGSVLSSFTMRYGIDWRREFGGAKYYDPVNTRGVVLDGKMSPEEKALDSKTGHEWYALTGPRGNLVVRMMLPQQWRTVVPLKLYYMDDVNALDPPEDDPGQRCAGFFMDWVNIPAGSYKYYLYYMVPNQAPPAGVPAMLNIIDKPLQTTARPFK